MGPAAAKDDLTDDPNAILIFKGVTISPSARAKKTPRRRWRFVATSVQRAPPTAISLSLTAVQVG